MKRLRDLCRLPVAVLSALACALCAALAPVPALASAWGSSYGDPFGFCAAQSQLPASYGVVVTNDPSVPTNPERDTFWGWHSNPGYDDWYGYWYGDFRGSPGDDSGWIRLMTVPFGTTGHWNFPAFGWAVHGHAKQYVGYYNWTFAGGCGLGGGYSGGPPPYMADVIGTPVTDIYVDSVPPYPPQPAANSVGMGTVGFFWAPVADRGDGAGPDYFISGLDHYTSWLTIDGGSPIQASDSAQPIPLTASGLAAGRNVCAHVTATDRVGNRSAEGTACATTPSQPAPTLIVGPIPDGQPVPHLIVGPIPDGQPVPHLIVGPVPTGQPVPHLIVGPVPTGQPVPTLIVGPVPTPPPPAPAPPPVPAAPPGPPPIPVLAELQIGSNPQTGLVGLPTWLWLDPAPTASSVEQVVRGVRYRIETKPGAVTWDFGDATWRTIAAPAGFGLAYPAESTVAHVYEAHNRWGYWIRAAVSVRITWSFQWAGVWQGPFDLPEQVVETTAQYRVQQGQPELGPR